MTISFLFCQLLVSSVVAPRHHIGPEKVILRHLPLRCLPVRSSAVGATSTAIRRQLATRRTLNVSEKSARTDARNFPELPSVSVQLGNLANHRPAHVVTHGS